MIYEAKSSPLLFAFSAEVKERGKSHVTRLRSNKALSLVAVSLNHFHSVAEHLSKVGILCREFKLADLLNDDLLARNYSTERDIEPTIN